MNKMKLGLTATVLLLYGCGSSSFGGSAPNRGGANNNGVNAGNSPGGGVNAAGTSGTGANGQNSTINGNAGNIGANGANITFAPGDGGFPLPTGVNVPVATVAIYANSAKSLYSYDLASAPVFIGTFQVGGRPVTDIYDTGIDGKGHMWAVSPSTLYAVNPQTAELFQVMQHGVRNAQGLTVLSDGSLVIAGDSIAILAAGNQRLTPLVAAGRYSTSGDVVALPDHKIYWAAVEHDSDHIIQIDPSTGATQDVGAIGAKNVWGLAFSAGNLYGFTPEGNVLAISPQTGASSGVVAHVDNAGWTGATTNPVVW